MSINKKIGIIIDSGSSIIDPKMDNVIMIPLIINEIIDGETISYNDLIDLTREDIYKKIINGARLSTSQAIFGECYNILEENLKKYNEILIFPLSKHLSGTYNTWIQVVKEFDNKKIYVFDHQDVGSGSYLAVIDCYNMFLNGNSPNDIQKYLDERSKKREAVIIINDLDTLIRGGRLSSFKGKIAKFLNLKVLVSFDGKLDVIDKTNNIESAVNKSLTHINKKIDFVKKGIKNILVIQNNPNKDNIEFQEYKSFISKWLEKNNVEGREKIVIDFLPSVISVHTGVNTLTMWIESN